MEVSILVDNQLNLGTIECIFSTHNKNSFIEFPGSEPIFITTPYIFKVVNKSMSMGKLTFADSQIKAASSSKPWHLFGVLRVQNVHLHTSSHCIHQAHFTYEKERQGSEAQDLEFIHSTQCTFIKYLLNQALGTLPTPSTLLGPMGQLPFTRQPSGHCEAPAKVRCCFSHGVNNSNTQPPPLLSPLPTHTWFKQFHFSQ